MELKQCENGHFYNSAVHMTCPYCNGENANVNSKTTFVNSPPNEEGAGFTEPVNMSKPSNDGFTSANFSGGGFTGGASNSFSAPAGDMERKTVAKIKKDTGFDPVVGWLVCIEGSEKGKDYRIHSDNNFIGRADNMDICVRGDDTISRENHAIISYDIVEKIFFLTPGNGRSIIRVNGKSIFTTVEVHPYDTIELGKSTLMFMPFCGEGFAWVD